MERGDGAWAGLRLLAAVGIVAVATGANGAAQDADVHMNNGFAAAAVRSAIGGAKRRLAREGCRDLFRFLTAYRRNPYLAESYIIHEILHTLGLGENPPSSQQITHRVVEACHN